MNRSSSSRRRPALLDRFLASPLLPVLAVVGVFLACDSTPPDPVGEERRVVIKTVSPQGTDLSGAIGMVVRVDDRAVSYSSVDGRTGFIANLTPGAHTLVVEATGYNRVETTLTVAADAPATFDHFVTLLGPADVDGRVVNAQTGDPVGGARVAFHRQAVVDSDPSAMPEIETTTDADGRFHIDDAPAGFFTVYVEKAGFTQVRVPGVEIVGGTFALPPLAMTVLPAAGTFRAVLTWGEQGQHVPADLDAHLTHRDGAGAVTYHVYYGNLTAGGTSLDRDDTDYGGPETVTIDLSADGTYRYSVFNFTDQSAEGVAGMFNGNAMVQLYGATGLIGAWRARNLEVPVPAGNTWRVFELVKSGAAVTVRDNEGETLGTFMADGSGDTTVFLTGPGKPGAGS